MSATKVYVRQDKHGVMRVGETRVMLDSAAWSSRKAGTGGKRRSPCSKMIKTIYFGFVCSTSYFTLRYSVHWTTGSLYTGLITSSKPSALRPLK